MRPESNRHIGTCVVAGVALLFGALALSCNKGGGGQEVERAADSLSAQPGEPQTTPVQNAVHSLEVLCGTAFPDKCTAAVDAAMADHDVGALSGELAPLCKEKKAGWACLCVARLKHKVGDDAGAREYVLNSCQSRYLPGCGAAGDIALELDVVKGKENPFETSELLRYYAGVLLATDGQVKQAINLFSAFCDGNAMEMCEIGGVYAHAVESNDLAEALANKACQAGRTAACRSLGAWQAGRGETDKAVSTYRNGCTGGDQRSCVFLADLLYENRDRKESSRLFKDACLAGESMGCIGLGRSYGEDSQPMMAIEYYARACQQGEAQGCYLGGLASREQGLNDAARESLHKACSDGVKDACSPAKELQEQFELGNALEEHFKAIQAKKYIDGALSFPKDCRVRVGLEKIISDAPNLIRSAKDDEVKALLNELRVALAEPEGREYIMHVSYLVRVDDVFLGPSLSTYVFGLERILDVMSGRRMTPKARARFLKELTGIDLWTELKGWEREVLSGYRTVWTIQALLAEKLRGALRFPGQRVEALELSDEIAGLAVKGISQKDMDAARESMVHFWRDANQYEPR